MQSLIDSFTDWIKGNLVSAIMTNISNLFDAVNNEVSQVATDVGTTPANFSPGVFNLIRNLSTTVVMPIAGLILTFIACYELIQLVISHNNLANFETWIFFKWIFKTFVAVELITHCFDITMAVFDVSSSVIRQSGGLVNRSTAVSTATLLTMQATLEAMGVFELFGAWLEIFVIRFGLSVMSKLIFVIVYGRMIEIYLMVSLAPIPMSTFGNREQSMMGQNYVRSLFALGFQGFLILVCVGIYAVLISSVSFSSDIVGSLWGVMGYTILLCFTLFKTGSVTKSVFHAH